MNRITATCIAGTRRKTTSRSRIHFFASPREANSFTRRFFAFGLGIFAKRLRWRPERNPLFSMGPRTNCIDYQYIILR